MATKKKTTSKRKAAAKRTPAKTKTKGSSNDATRVFAIRISDAELAAIHKAAGPRNATRFMRAVAAAFANDDVTAFETALKKARQARS